MKNHLFALASAALVSTAAFALDPDKPTDGKPTDGKSKDVVAAPTGQAIATDTGSVVVGEYLGDGKKGCGCDPCHRCLWVYGEYIRWWTRSDDLPPLLTTTRATPNGPVTSQHFGENTADDDRQGVRAGGGFYPHCKTKNIGIEANWFSLGNLNDTATYTSDGRTTLGRPFTDATTGTPAVLALGGGTTGVGTEVGLTHSSRFYGGNIGLRRKLAGNGDCTGGCGGGVDFGGGSCAGCLEFLIGYQFYQLNEGQQIRTAQNFPVGATRSLFVAEDFETDNSYHGGYLGLAGEYNCGKWFVAGNGRAGVGDVRQISRISGTTTTVANGVTTAVPTGQLLALTSNVGTRHDNDFTWGGEAGVKIGVAPVCWFRAWVGYDFLYIHDVNRPGGIIDPAVNRAQIVRFGADPLAPNYNPRRESFWAHGLNVGAELKF